MREPDDPLVPPRPDAGTRMRRAGAALLAQLRALFIPDRGVPPLVSMGRARLSIAIALGCALLVPAAVTSRIDLAPTVRAEMAKGPQGPGGPGGPAAGQPPGEDKTDRDVAEEIDKRTAMVEVTTWLGSPLGMAGAIVGFAIALLLLGRFVGGKPTFSRSLAASSIAGLPWAVQAIIKAAAIWRQDSIGPHDINQMVVSHLFMPPPGNTMLLRVAAAADGFALWSLVLAGFGLAAAAGISRKRSFLAVTIAYLLFVLLLTSIFAK